jgi:hypothetical protein
MGWTILTNDLMWWIPFGLMLAAAYRFHHYAAHSAIAAASKSSR